MLSAARLTSRYVGYFSPPLNTRCSRKWAMPFSSGRSVRAPASKATRIVVARVPGRATRCSGRPLGRVELVMCGTPVSLRLAVRGHARDDEAHAGGLGGGRDLRQHDEADDRRD